MAIEDVDVRALLKIQQDNLAKLRALEAERIQALRQLDKVLVETLRMPSLFAGETEDKSDSRDRA